MTLYIVRHGQTEENLQRILQGHLPGQLTDTGKEQMEQAAMMLQEKGTAFDCIVSSDLKRAMDSAQIIATRLGLTLTPYPILRERDWGPCTGMPVAEAAQIYRTGGQWDFPPAVETEEQIYMRAQRALELLKTDYDGRDLIVVTHGLFARCLIAAHFGCSFREVNSMMNAEIRTLSL